MDIWLSIIDFVVRYRHRVKQSRIGKRARNRNINFYSLCATLPESNHKLNEIKKQEVLKL